MTDLENEFNLGLRLAIWGLIVTVVGLYLMYSVLTRKPQPTKVAE